MATKTKESVKGKKQTAAKADAVEEPKKKTVAKAAARKRKTAKKAAAGKDATQIPATRTKRKSTESSLLDLSADAVKKMIKAAKKRGYVTMDELNNVLPSDEVTSEQIEDTMSMLSDMGINVVEEEDVGGRSRNPPMLPQPAAQPLPPPKNVNPLTVPMIRCACICAKWVRLNCCRAKAKLRLPSASRLAAKP